VRQIPGADRDHLAGARARDVNQAVHGWGGIVLHDVISQFFRAPRRWRRARDGLIPVAAGAGGHAGRACQPFAFVQELREWFDGPIALSGSIANGRAVLAAQAMGADLAYIGSAFVATQEARAAQGYKDMIVERGGEDIVYTNLFTGVHGNYLRPSIERAGLDPANLPTADPSKMNFGSGGNQEAKAWARHLGLRPGHRGGEDHPDGGRAGGAAGGRVRGGEVRAGGEDGVHLRRAPGVRGGVRPRRRTAPAKRMFTGRA